MPLPFQRPLSRWVQRVWLRLRRGYDPSLPLGRRGELAAADYLRRHGYQILAHSEADALGEIDLIALQHRPQRRIVFVEVKTRTSDTLDHPADRVDRDKQRRITRAALTYLKRHRLLEVPTRLDVIAVWWIPGEVRPARLQHFEGAFEATGNASLYS